MRYDGEPCEQLITYYLQVGSGLEDDLSYAVGACHRHLGHAFDVLYEADRIGLADACDDRCRRRYRLRTAAASARACR